MDVAVAGGAAHRAATAGEDAEVAARERRAHCCAGHVAAGRGNGVVLRVDQPGAGPAIAIGRERGDAGAVGYLHIRAAGFDKAAVVSFRAAVGVEAGRGGGIELAAHIGGARFHTGQQQNVAGLALHRLRFDDAAVVDGALEQTVARSGGEDDLPAVGADQAAVFCEGIECAFGDFKLDEFAAGEGQLRLAACAHDDAAQMRVHAAGVDGLVADQGEVATVLCIQGALVDNAAIAASGVRRVAEHILAVEEVAVGDVEGGRDQATYVYLRTRPEQHAVGVDQEHLAGGGEVAEDFGAAVAEHAVERNAVVGGLLEMDAVAAADVEALPVDRDLVGGLVDQHRGGGGAADSGGAGADLPPGGESLRACLAGQQRHACTGEGEGDGEA